MESHRDSRMGRYKTKVSGERRARDQRRVSNRLTEGVGKGNAYNRPYMVCFALTPARFISPGLENSCLLCALPLQYLTSSFFGSLR